MLVYAAAASQGLVYNNHIFAINACGNGELRGSLPTLGYIPKFAVSPLMYAATASTETLYNIYRRSQFRH